MCLEVINLVVRRNEICPELVLDNGNQELLVQHEDAEDVLVSSIFIWQERIFSGDHMASTAVFLIQPKV